MVFLWFTLLIISHAEVEELSVDDLERYMDHSQITIVKYYLPTCPACKMFGPKYSEASEFFKHNEIKFGQFNCAPQERTAICRKEIYQTFPTVKIYLERVNKSVLFEKDSPKEIVDFVLDNLVAPKTPKVVNLTSSNFDKIVFDKTQTVFVLFYMNWCSHCQAFQPKFEELSGVFSNVKDLVFGQVDCEEQIDICKKFLVLDFPNLVFFDKKNKETTYSPSKSKEVVALTQFINKKFNYTVNYISAKYNVTRGRSKELDVFAKDFLSKDNQNEIIEKVEKLEGGEIYVNIMKRLQKEGNGYIEKENERIIKLINDNQIQLKQLEKLQIKFAVLQAF
ncbi:protein disulfide isomerase, putative [Entamoeba invadens IP1]|uniref:protein disulfide-isomerase n=1 Tax=Entamoeba invadens IP1 TaxID=370355 RepID=A0A0A1UA12_ENTIV|nr:protein disulfide isomerase, putative [Entamoeba invadens IP1]ELP88979.1 protein disulfide isomerase, putative [Entamoeba invadens IP1]|eukprot:XP_004255750.1 protein disulfide isomerase, putative [Entamoeba invadens IP1]